MDKKFAKAVAAVGIVILIIVIGYFAPNNQWSISKLDPANTSSSTPNTVKEISSLSSEIIKINNIKDSIDKSIESGMLREKKKELGYSIPYEPTLKVIYTDKENAVYKYLQEAGSEDSALRSNFYYDNNHKLRFVLIYGRAVNGSELEHKIYFDENGKRISETHEYTKGEGYTFPEEWPEDQIIFDPIKEFNKQEKY
jgi:hypothetical protein